MNLLLLHHHSKAGQHRSLKIGGSGSHFDLQLLHPFPTNFQPPLADSDAIVVNTNDPPEPGIYRYNLQVTVIISILPQSVAFNSVEVNITITETLGE